VWHFDLRAVITLKIASFSESGTALRASLIADLATPFLKWLSKGIIVRAVAAPEIARG
jgi:hypothetical protein